MPIEVFNNERVTPMSTPTIKLDKHGRIYLSASTIKLLGINREESNYVYLGYDKETKKIGLVSANEVNYEGIKPFHFQPNRPYASARLFMLENRIKIDGSATYELDGKDGAFYTFKLVNALDEMAIRLRIEKLRIEREKHRASLIDRINDSLPDNS